MTDSDQSGQGNGSENPIFGQTPPSAPPPGQAWGQPGPPPPGQPPGWGQPQQPVWGQQPAGAYGGMPTSTGTNGFAIASLICAFLCWPLGLVFGFIARSQIKRSGQGGGGLALAGLIISGIAGAIIIIAFIVAAANGGCAGTGNYCNNLNNQSIHSLLLTR